MTSRRLAAKKAIGGDTNTAPKRGGKKGQTPQDICKSCSSVFTDSADKLLQCERCFNWVCMSCLGYTDTEYKLLNDHPEIHWFCQECQSPALKAVLTDKDIEERCNAYMVQMTDRLQKLEESVETKADKEDVDMLKAKVTSLTTTVDSIEGKIEGKLAEMEQERIELDRRKKNFIIYDLDE